VDGVWRGDFALTPECQNCHSIVAGEGADVPLAGADDVHGARMVGAVPRQHTAWLDQSRQLADKIAELPSAIVGTMKLIERWGRPSGDRVNSVAELSGNELKKYDWENFFKTYILTRSDYH